MPEEKKTILIAEDENDIREIYSRALATGGFEVLQVGNGLEVFECLKRVGGKVDLILTDIVMPKMDGMEVLEKLKADPKYRDVPVIVASNLDNEEDRTQAFSLGAEKYFVKSRHTPLELVGAINETLLVGLE